MSKARQKESPLWTQWLVQAQKQGAKLALIDAATGRVWSADELTAATSLFSGPLLNYRQGDRIAFRLPNGPDWIALFLALQKAGLAAMPLDAATPTAGCLETARRLGARALFFDGKFHALGQPRVQSKSICCVKVTSGTGSIPKAVECRAGHLLADGENIIRTMGLRTTDRNLAVIPLGHSYGLGNLVLPLILQGTAMVTATEYVPRQLLEWIDRYRVTVFPGVPALFRVLAALPLPKVAGAGPCAGSPIRSAIAAPRGKFPSLRVAISAGATLPPAIAQAFFDRFALKIHNFYGSSETGGICYDRTGSASFTGRSVGKPLWGVSISVKSGRITLSSKAVATRTGCWQVGDLGEWNQRGELVLLGRSTTGANIGGKKVHPLEVERVLRSLPQVTDAAVWLQNKSGRDFLAAAVETTATRAEIERALVTKLSPWKLPKTILVARELPRTSRGKLDLTGLKRQG